MLNKWFTVLESVLFQLGGIEEKLSKNEKVIHLLLNHFGVPEDQGHSVTTVESEVTPSQGQKRKSDKKALPLSQSEGSLLQHRTKSGKSLEPPEPSPKSPVDSSFKVATFPPADRSKSPDHWLDIREQAWKFTKGHFDLTFKFDNIHARDLPHLHALADLMKAGGMTVCAAAAPNLFSPLPKRPVRT